MALHTTMMIRITPFIFEIALSVLVIACFIPLCAFGLPLGVTSGPVDNRVPVSRLVTIVNTHQGIAVITRDTLEVVVEGQVVDGSALKLTLVQMTRETLVIGLLKLLCDGISTGATATRHLKNGTRSTLSTVNVVTLAVRGGIGTDHADSMLLFAIAAGAVH
jgi:hypothetical protein